MLTLVSTTREARDLRPGTKIIGRQDLTVTLTDVTWMPDGTITLFGRDQHRRTQIIKMVPADHPFTVVL